MDAAETMLERLTPDQLDEIYRELGTSEDKIGDDVKTVAEWMRKQPHFRGIKVNEHKIKLYLILFKNSMEGAKKKLDQYYTIKTLVPEYYGERDPSSQSLQQSMDTALVIPLPKLTSEGFRVSLSRLRNPDVDKYVFADHIKVSFMSIDVRMSELDVFKKEIFLYDLSKYTVSHISLVLPSIKKMLYCITNAYPLRIHQVHVFNMPSYAQSAFNVVVGLLKKKLASRIIVHESVDDLKNYISPDILPLDYGGTYPKTSEEICEDWKKELVRQRDWFLSEKSEVCDERKRAQVPNVYTDIMTGMEGSFRRLEVD